ncbi:hypothetical protein FACS189460_5960 [Deltaproteobacteria bacterium]|nr:hypothetical protein FACS189460_5960 [Deltaproteobacteria bacterium]
MIDTTVQEKNITFPTDSKLQSKIIVWCWKISTRYGLSLRRSYKRELKGIIKAINFSRGVRKAKIVNKARRRLKTIAATLVREVKRKLSPPDLEVCRERLALFDRVLKQKKKDKAKIYSLHEPGTLCIAKGKSHKPYEFGSKVCFVVGKKAGVIVGARNFDRNLYDGDTVEETVKMMSRILDYKPGLGIADKGFRGRKTIEGVNILTPANQSRKLSESEKRRNKKRHCRRSAIEPVIGHLKLISEWPVTF